jgi:hypothetical protein
MSEAVKNAHESLRNGLKRCTIVNVHAVNDEKVQYICKINLKKVDHDIFRPKLYR